MNKKEIEDTLGPAMEAVEKLLKRLTGHDYKAHLILKAKETDEQVVQKSNLQRRKRNKKKSDT